MDSNWVQRINDNIEKQKEHLHKKDIRFFQVDQLLRIADRLETFGNECAECREYKKELESLTGALSDYINSTPRKKRDFEKQTDAIKKHLKTAHQIIPAFYYVSLYSFIGLAIGGVLGAIPGLLFISYMSNFIIFSVIVGLTTGYILGSKKDWKVRYDKRLL